MIMIKMHPETNNCSLKRWQLILIVIWIITIIIIGLYENKRILSNEMAQKDSMSLNITAEEFLNKIEEAKVLSK